MNLLNFTSSGLSLLLIILFSSGPSFAQEKAFLCGAKDQDAPQEVIRLMSRLPVMMAQQNARTDAGEMRICRIAVDIDSDTYVKYERDTAAIIQKVTENMEKASKYFEKEANIRMMVTSIRIYKDDGPDPYAGESDIYALLNILGNSITPNPNFDKKLYLYTKPVSGATGVAFIGGAYNVSTLENVFVILHELAHNFGSFHSNSCQWPGGPLDYCGGVEGDCYNKSLEVTTTTSLMSPCGGNVAGRALHPMIKAVIVAHAEANFVKIESAPLPVSLPNDITISKGDFYSWQASLNAKFYEFSYATNNSFSDEIIVATPFNGISLMQQTLGTAYFVRARALNSFGVSDWSNIAQVRIDPDQFDIPTILGPAVGSIFPSQENVTLSFSTVAGATAYRIQVTPLYDFQFSNPTDQIITQNQYVHPTYLGGYKWRVKAIQGVKTGKWSEVGYFSANPQLNSIGLFLPITENRINVPRTLPFRYIPNETYPNITVTIADNPDFNTPLFQRNYTPYLEIADVFKDLPANTKLYLRVQRHPDDLLNYPDHDLVDYVVDFTTGSTNAPNGLTFLSEKNQLVFGRMNPKIVVSEEHIWLSVIDAGFIKLDQKDLTYQAFNRENTDGLLGVGLDNAIRTDDEMNVDVLNSGSPGIFRKVKLTNEVPTSDALVTEIFTASNIQGYHPQSEIFWTQRTIFKETLAGPTALLQFSDSQFIRDVRIYNNKAWILLTTYSPVYGGDVTVMDLGNPNLIYNINSSTSPVIKNFIDQIEIQNDGRIWLRQRDVFSDQTSIAYYNGSDWSVFNAGNAPFGSQITSLGLSPSGITYILASGNETQVYKFNNSNWEKTGPALPFKDFGGDLWIDKNENFWISNQYGLSVLTSEDALPVTIVDFSAAAEGNLVRLKWEVVDQIQMSKYVVEHSTDAKKFSAIGETPAIDSAFYSITHNNPAPGINYYRLKSVEADADFAYSKTVAVNMPDMEDMFLFPNPATDQLEVKVRPDLINQPARIMVFDSNGKKIFEKKINKLKGQEQIDIFNWTAGSYLMRFENKSWNKSKIVQVVR